MDDNEGRWASPSEPPHPDRLRDLWLEGMGLASAPAWLSMCRALERVSLYGNALELAPEELVDLPKLSHLNLGRNRLSKAPSSVPPAVHALVLARNSITHLPGECLGAPRRWRIMDLAHNRLGSVPAVLREHAFERGFLYLGGNPLGNLPDWLTRIHGIEYLSVEDVGLEELPEAIGKLDLVVFRAGSNGLTELPASLSACRRLRELGLRRNRLSELPGWIGRLSPLRQLDLRGNRIAHLPPELGALKALRVLDLRANVLTEVPTTLQELPALEKVDLRWNRHVPDSSVVRRLRERGCLVLE